MATFMRHAVTAILVSAALAGATPARAQFFFPEQQQQQPQQQPRPQVRAPVQAPAPPVVSDAPAPFDADLQRLAEILGALHYLRGICGTNEGQKWRGEMQALCQRRRELLRQNGLIILRRVFAARSVHLRNTGFPQMRRDLVDGIRELGG